MYKFTHFGVSGVAGVGVRGSKILFSLLFAHFSYFQTPSKAKVIDWSTKYNCSYQGKLSNKCFFQSPHSVWYHTSWGDEAQLYKVRAEPV